MKKIKIKYFGYNCLFLEIIDYFIYKNENHLANRSAFYSS